MTDPVLHDRDLEYQVIADLACDQSLWRKAEHLTPEHFGDVLASQAFAKMQETARAGRQWVMDDFPLEILAAQVPDLFRLPEYVKRLEETYAIRAGYRIGADIAQAAARGDIARVRELLSKASLPSRRVAGVTLAEAAAEVFDRLGKGDQGKLPTGFGAMDATGLLHRSESTVLAARPSMGKTELALQVAYNVTKAGGVVLFASLEMSARQLAGRLAQWHARRGIYETSPLAVEALANAATALMLLEGMVIVDTPMSTADLTGYARAVADKHRRLDLIVSDHLRLFQDRHEREDKRLGLITSAHKALAKEFDIPVLACAQLNRGPEGREDKRPGLVDLRDSGQIEEDADKVAFLFRDAYYTARKTGGSQSGPADVYLDKNRNGALWGVQLYFDAEHGAAFYGTRPTP